MSSVKDSRNLVNGYAIPKEGYCDQPYVVILNDGAWLCVLTTGVGKEGDEGQHSISARSTDQGKTWEAPVDIEPAVPPESSWVMPLVVPSGRAYAFYLYNAQNLRQVISDSGMIRRVDTLGEMAFKYSDDGGRSWSKDHYIIPIRETKIDRTNPYGGKVRFLWGVGKPIVHGEHMYMGFAKVGRFGDGFMATSEGFLLHSDNILTEMDPNKINWELLPDGDVGIQAPYGPVADEHNVTTLSDGSLYCTYRTIEGHNGAAYSRDGGHTWTPPAYAEYSPGGRWIKHSRAANFVRKFSNGKFLLWFHNNGTNWYNRAGNRNVAWLAGGVEKDGYIHWSQPEIALYDDDPMRGPSYPDFIEEGGRLFITATQKTIARVYEVEPELLEGLWNQAEIKEVAPEGLVLNLRSPQGALGGAVQMPTLPKLNAGGGLSLDFWVRFDSLEAGQVLFDSRGADGKGMVVSITDENALHIALNDGRITAGWDSDRKLFRTKTWHHVAIIVDGGPNVISFVVDGILCDGSDQRPFGWGRFSRYLGDVNGAPQAQVCPALKGQMAVLRLYDRYLRTSEAVGNYQAGR